MVDAQGFIFDFTRVKDFFEQWNILFKLTNMNSSNNFELVFCSDTPPNIDECLTSGGGLDESTVTIATNGVVPCSLKWENETISIRDSATWNINMEVGLRSVFIRDRATGYVMGYCINMDEYTVSNKVVFESGVKIWSIHDE